MSRDDLKSYHFGEIVVDQIRGELRVADQIVDVEPRVLELLTFLAEHHGQLITRDQLIEGVWKGRIVSDSAVASCLAMARRVIGDSGTHQSIIRTIPKQGVMFIPEPEILNQTQGQSNTSERQNEKPSIVVLPFRNQSNDTTQDFFAGGIAEDITTALARFEEIVVLAFQTASVFSANQNSPSEFSKELNVDYFLEGGVQRANDRVRISVRLVEVVSQAVLWSARFDRDDVDVFAIQDEVSATVANALVGEVSNRHIALTAFQAPRQLKAYDHVLKAQKHIWSASEEDLLIARAEAEAAIELEPDYARAHAALSWAHLTLDQNGWGDGGEGQYSKAVAHARIAVALDSKNAWGQAMLGISMFWRGEERTERNEHLEQAVRLNPSNSHIRMMYGAQLAYAGCGEQAVEQLDLAVRLNPLFPELYLLHRARAHFVMENYPSAVSDSTHAVAGLPNHPTAWAMLAVCRMALQDKDAAAQAIETLLHICPDFTVRFARQSYPYLVNENRDRFNQLLEQAGAPP